MLNRYPLWKYLMVIFVVAISFLYAAPNLFGEDPALQVSGSRGTQVTSEILAKTQQRLTAAGIDIKSAALEDNQLLVRFRDTDDQLKGKEVVAETLGDNYITALNLRPPHLLVTSHRCRPAEIRLGLAWWCALLDGSGHGRGA